jgi:hypothetical protein
MKNLERIFYLFIIVGTLACADLSPKKNFVSTLYSIDWDSRCLAYVDVTSEQTLTRCFVEYVQDADLNWHPIDDKGAYMDGIISIHVSDYQKELDFQNLQKKQCKSWTKSE